MRGYALLVRGNEIHGNKPLAQRQLRVLEYRADRYVELAVASLAEIAAVVAELAVVFTAIGTHDITVRPAELDDGILAYLVGIKVLHHGEQTVEF